MHTTLGTILSSYISLLRDVQMIWFFINLGPFFLYLNAHKTTWRACKLAIIKATASNFSLTLDFNFWPSKS